MTVTMQAVVIEVQQGRLIVRDVCAQQRVVVHTQNAQQHRPGDCIWVLHSGAMTMSIPPQVSAIKIIKLPGIGPFCWPF